ncbi:MAG: GAF domain-containing protein, partial [Anaerolineae bacterium]
MSEMDRDNAQMDALHTRIGEVGKILSRLRDLIRAQRMALEHGESPDDILDHLRIWESTLGRIEHEAVLEKNARLHSLYEVSQALNTSLDWEETAETVIDAVIQVTGAERGTLLLRQNGGFKPKVSRGPLGRSLGRNQARFSQSIIERALEEKKPILTTNAR